MQKLGKIETALMHHEIKERKPCEHLPVLKKEIEELKQWQSYLVPAEIISQWNIKTRIEIYLMQLFNRPGKMEISIEKTGSTVIIHRVK